MSDNAGSESGVPHGGSMHRGGAGSLAGSNPASVSAAGSTGHSPFPGHNSATLGLPVSAPGSNNVPFPGPGPPSNGMQFPGPPSNNIPFPGPGPLPTSSNIPFPGPGPSSNNIPFPGPGPVNDKSGFQGQGPPMSMGYGGFPTNSPYAPSMNIPQLQQMHPRPSGMQPNPMYFNDPGYDGPSNYGPGPQGNMPRQMLSGSMNLRPELMLHQQQQQQGPPQEGLPHEVSSINPSPKQPPSKEISSDGFLFRNPPPEGVVLSKAELQFYQAPRDQFENYVRDHQSEMKKRHPTFMEQPQPRPFGTPLEPVPVQQPPTAENASSQRKSLPDPTKNARPMPEALFQIPAHLLQVPVFPGPGPSKEQEKNELWKDRIDALVPKPSIPLSILEGLHTRSVGYLCGLAKDIIQEIQARLMDIFSMYRSRSWNAATFADADVAIHYMQHLHLKLCEIRAYVDRKMINTEVITPEEFIQMMTVAEPKIVPDEIINLREIFATNTKKLIAISNNLKELEWHAANGDPRAISSSLRDDLIRMVAMEDNRRKPHPFRR